MHAFGQVALRTLFTFIVLLIVTRVLGRKQISQLTFFNYMTGITIGSMAANFTVERQITAMEGVTGVLGWCLLTLLVELISLKWPKARVVLDGQPVILISRGKIMERELAKTRMNMDDLTMMLRNKNVFSVDEVVYAIFEPNGAVTVMRKEESQLPVKSDLPFIPKKTIRHLPTKLIADGRPVDKNLRSLQLTEDWLKKELRKRHVLINEVFYAELRTDGSVYIDLYDKSKQ